MPQFGTQLEIESVEISHYTVRSRYCWTSKINNQFLSARRQFENEIRSHLTQLILKNEFSAHVMETIKKE